MRCQGPWPIVVCLGMGIFISFDTTAPTYWEDLPEALRKRYLGFLVSEYWDFLWSFGIFMSIRKIFFGENIFVENIFGKNIFSINIFFLPFPNLTALQTTPTSSQLLISDFWSWVRHNETKNSRTGRSNVCSFYIFRLVVIYHLLTTLP